MTMKNLLLSVMGVLTSAVCLLPSVSQGQDRPLPYPVMPTPSFEQALEQHTRSPSGAPGPQYWTNTAQYDLRAVLSPEEKKLHGEGHIRYQNRSPDTLQHLVVFLRQNIYQPGAARRTGGFEVTGGMHLARVAADGTPLIERESGVGYSVDGTLMRLRPPNPVLPGESIRLEFSWSYTIRSEGPGPRQGTDGQVFYLGYWYPHMAVYDDVEGWDTDPFLQHAELYADYADYDVRITAPEGWLVAATGTLQNPRDVLTRTVRKRLQRVAHTDSVVSVVGPDERRAGVSTQTHPGGTLTWHYRADKVRDFAFGTSDRYVWEATRAQTGSQRSMIHAFYRPDASAAWDRAAEFGRFAIEWLSEKVMPYPYPQMTVVEGVVGGGMEYPMITVIGGRGRSARSLFGTTVHEIAHMWFPMIIGSQENEHIWMDEGLATYLTRQARLAFWEDAAPWEPNSGYFRRAGRERETPLMRHGDLYPSVGSLVAASYDKASRMLYALRGLYGPDAFERALHTYARRWKYKHPYPYDLFNTFEDQLGEELDWFWTPMAYETWTLDQAVADVSEHPDSVTVTVEDRGLTPMPVLLEVTYANGTTREQRLPAEVWLNDGKRTATASFPAGDVRRVEIDPEQYLPDVQRANNVWSPAARSSQEHSSK